MNALRAELDESSLVIELGVPAHDEVAIVERKGWGHPDTLADHLAERLSRAYSRYTKDRFGAVLHHNFDKLALLGGACEVRYGSGAMLDPVRVQVNGRAARSCGGEEIPVESLVTDVVYEFLNERLPELEAYVKVELNITSNPSPGAVRTDDGEPERTRWFAPRSATDLRERRALLANDTSLGTGWAPEGAVERFARDLVDVFASPSEFNRERPWCGSDVKLMAHAVGNELDVVLCVPQKCSHVGSRRAYLDNRHEVLDECYRRAAAALPGWSTRFRLNVRDIPERDELYLTYTGSSIESGDEGVVGRGNRVNGLITPLRPMNLEGANGKNPVYHVGKLYNIAARRLAQRLYEETGSYTEVHLVSATGHLLARPWRVTVRTAADDVSLSQMLPVVRDVLDNFPAITEEVLVDGLVLS